MAAGNDWHGHCIFIIMDGSDSQVIRSPFTADQFQRLVRKFCLLASLLLPLGIVQHEGFINIIKFCRPLQLPGCISQRFYVLRPFHIVFDLKYLIKDLIWKWFRWL